MAHFSMFRRSVLACALLAAVGSGVACSQDTTVAGLREVLKRQDRDETFGLRVPEDHPTRNAIKLLEAVGSDEAIEGLLEFLVADGMPHGLKMLALESLGKIGSQKAVDAIGEFEKWARQRFENPAPFQFGRKDYAIDHFAPHELEPLSTTKDADGNTWSLFEWRRFGKAELWVTQAEDLEAGLWAQPIMVGGFLSEAEHAQKAGVAEQFLHFTVDGESRWYSLTQARADQDADGVPDVVENAWQTSPTAADTDGDGKPDGKDANPLTPEHKAHDDMTEIRQAVFTMLFATSDSQDALVVVREAHAGGAEPQLDALTLSRLWAAQEYYGFGGVVLSSRAIRDGYVNLTAIDVKLDSDVSATAAIEDYEGDEAASHHEAKLKKLHGKWVVVSFRLTVIS